MKASLLLVLLFLSACAHQHFKTTDNGSTIRLCHPPELVVIDKRVPVEYRKAIVNGFKYWNEALGKQVFFDAGEADLDLDESDTFGGFIAVGVLTEELSKTLPTPGKERAAAFYKYNGRGCKSSMMVMISPRSFDGDLGKFETTIRHEFGHVLGLEHSASFTDLMFVAPSSERTMQHPRDASDDELKALKGIYK